jgi:DNA-binding NarL/FixJ family response regulator
VSKVRVLLVDDDDDLRTVLRDLFNEAAADIELVGSYSRASDAMRYLRADAPDVLIVDVRLGGTDGLELTQLLLEVDASLPVIVFSAYLDSTARATAEHLGVREILDKTDVHRLVDAITRHGGHRRDARCAQA